MHIFLKRTEKKTLAVDITLGNRIWWWSNTYKSTFSPTTTSVLQQVWVGQLCGFHLFFFSTSFKTVCRSSKKTKLGEFCPHRRRRLKRSVTAAILKAAYGGLYDHKMERSAMENFFSFDLKSMVWSAWRRQRFQTAAMMNSKKLMWTRMDLFTQQSLMCPWV